MSIILYFIIGFCIYTFCAYATYSTELKSYWFYSLIFMVGGLITNLCWSRIALISSNINSLRLGLIWDSYIIFSFVFFGTLASKNSLTWIHYSAILMVVVGLITLKVVK